MQNIFRLKRFGGFLLLVFCLFLTTNSLYAQWTQVIPGGPIGYLVFGSFAVSGTNVFAGTSSAIYLSTVNGTSWTKVNTGLTSTRTYALAISGTNTFAGTYDGGVFLSTNNGAMWTSVNTGLTTSNIVFSLAISDTKIFAGTSGGIYLSTNNGGSWTAVNAGLTNPFVHTLAVSGTNLFAGTGGGVFISTNNGKSWSPVNTGLTVVDVYSLAVSGNNLFAGTPFGGVFLSTNNGASWTAVNTGLKNTYVYAVNSLAVSGTKLFAGTASYGVFLSTNNGTSWAPVNSGLTRKNIWCLAVSDSNIFAGTDDGAVWRCPLSEMVTSVESDKTDLPTQFSLRQNYPNPFNPSTTISFSLPSKSYVSLRLFDALGREVSVVISEELSAGNYSRLWSGSGLPSGIYFYRLHAGSFTETKRLLLLR